MTISLVIGRSLFVGLAFAAVSPENIRGEIYNKISSVNDFTFIRDQCSQLGIRCWIDGETAALYGSYVRRALLAHEGGLPRVFNFNFMDIYGSRFSLAQLIVDGSPEKAAQLQIVINRKLSHSISDPAKISDFVEPSKSLNTPSLFWSVKPASEIKPGLENDSFSIAAVELTQTTGHNGDTENQPVRKLVEREKRFTQDMGAQGNRFYLRANFPNLDHIDQEHAANLLIATAQFLNHSFKQHQMPSPEDQNWIKQLVGKIDLNQLKSNYAARTAFEKEANGFGYGNPELSQSRAVLKAVGLEDLIGKVVPIMMRVPLGTFDRSDIPQFWLHQNIMPEGLVGMGNGPLLKDAWPNFGNRSDIFFTHSTHLIKDYESIIASDDGHPNAFFSGGAGGNLGHNFYTFPAFPRDYRYGMNPLRLFPVSDQVRMGTDLYLDAFPILRNRLAFRVSVPDYSQVNFVDLLNRVSSPDLFKNIFEDDPQKGPLLNLHLALLYAVHSPPLSASDEVKALSLVKEAVEKPIKGRGDLNILKVWFALPDSSKHSEILTRLLEKSPGTLTMIKAIVPEHWSAFPELVARVKAIGALAPTPQSDQQFMNDIVPKIRKIIAKAGGPLTMEEESILNEWFSSRFSMNYTELLEQLLEISPQTLKTIKLHWIKNIDLLNKAAQLGITKDYSSIQKDTEEEERCVIGKLRESMAIQANHGI